MPCAYPETLAGTGDDKTTVNIIHKSPSIWKCSRGDIRRPIIVALPVFVRLHRIPTTDLASSGSRQTSEIMMTSYSQLLWKSRTVHGSRDNSLWQLHIIIIGRSSRSPLSTPGHSGTSASEDAESSFSTHCRRVDGERQP